MNVATVVENPEYTFFGFLSTLGGAVSLYLGISFIQLFEVAELAAKIFWSFVSRDQLQPSKAA